MVKRKRLDYGRAGGDGKRNDSVESVVFDRKNRTGTASMLASCGLAQRCPRLPISKHEALGLRLAKALECSETRLTPCSPGDDSRGLSKECIDLGVSRMRSVKHERTAAASVGVKVTMVRMDDGRTEARAGGRVSGPPDSPEGHTSLGLVK